MIIGIDFGITNTDIVAYKENNYDFFSVKSEKLNIEFLEKIFDFIDIDINKVEKIAVTGGKSSDLFDLYNNIPVIKVNEVQAIGCGAKKFV
jgi:type II pantothenate kinase